MPLQRDQNSQQIGPRAVKRTTSWKQIMFFLARAAFSRLQQFTHGARERFRWSKTPKAQCLATFGIYKHFFIFGNFIFGGGGYNNAQPATSYFVFFYLTASTFWEWPVCEVQFLLPPTFSTRPRQRPFFEFRILLATICYYYKTSNFGRGSCRNLIFVFC